MEEELGCIVFVSSAVKNLSPDDIRQMAINAGSINSDLGITDLTIFAHGNVLVLMEGPWNTLKKRFEELKKHPSHHNIIKILSTSVSYRSFEGYPLALKIYGSQQYKCLDDFVSPERKEYFEEFLNLDTQVSNAVRNFIRINT
jgi:hypothetical protein